MTATAIEVEYRDIPGWPGYRVGNDGSVWCRRGMGYLRHLLMMSHEELRSRFQVLCANCNCIKRIEEGEHHAREIAAVP